MFISWSTLFFHLNFWKLIITKICVKFLSYSTIQLFWLKNKLEQKLNVILYIPKDKSYIYVRQINIFEIYVITFVPICQSINDSLKRSYSRHTMLAFLKYLMILSTIMIYNYFQHLSDLICFYFIYQYFLFIKKL